MKKSIGLVVILVFLVSSCSSLDLLFPLMNKAEAEANIENMHKQIQRATDESEVRRIFQDANLLSSIYQIRDLNLKDVANNRIEELAVQNEKFFYEDIDNNIVNTFDILEDRIKKSASEANDFQILLDWYEEHLELDSSGTFYILSKETGQFTQEIPVKQITNTFLDVYMDIESNIISQAVSAMDISILLDWYEDSYEYSPTEKIYFEAGSENEEKAYTTAKRIEEKLIATAVESKDETIITSYFSTNPYERLPHNDPESARKNGWEHAEKTSLKIYLDTLEKNVYQEAIANENPSIYTEQYPEGQFDASKIPDDKIGRAYKTALDSLENAKQFLEDFPNSEHQQEIVSYVIREEWFSSDSYRNALENIPQEMLEAQIILREGIIDLDMSFQDFFINRAPILDIEFKYKNNNMTVILSEEAPNKINITIDMTYRTTYGGILFIDQIEIKQGFLPERSRTFEDKYSDIVIIYQLFI